MWKKSRLQAASSGAAIRRVPPAPRMRYGQTYTEANKSCKPKNLDVHLGGNYRQKKCEKGKKAKTIEHREENGVFQPLFKKLVSNPQKHQDQEKEQGAAKRGAFEIEDYVAGEEPPEAKLHGPKKTMLDLLNPPGRGYPALSTQGQDNHYPDDHKIKKKDYVVDHAVDPRHREGVPDKPDAEIGNAGILFVSLVKITDPGSERSVLLLSV